MMLTLIFNYLKLKCLAAKILLNLRISIKIQRKPCSEQYLNHFNYSFMVVANSIR